MSWPIPSFSSIEKPKPISLRLWLPMLAVIATAAVGVVLLLWPHGKPTHSLQFWGTLIGAPLVACALVFGVKLDSWEDEQTNAEELEREHDRLKGLWRDWTRRKLCIVDVAAFPATTNEIVLLGDATVNLKNKDRTVSFVWAQNRATALWRTRLLHLVAARFADVLRTRREFVVTLMLDDTSLTQAEVWTNRVERILGRRVPRGTFHVEAQLATGGAQWITQLVDTVDSNTRLVIAAQFWTGIGKEEKFSEGAAAFLIEPCATNTGLIFRPMTSACNALEEGLTQIKEFQTTPDPLTDVWSAGCEYADSSVLRSVLKKDPKYPVTEHMLDGVLGNPGPASGWIALAIAMEVMRGGGPQLVAWREPESESLHLCTVSPMPQKETTV
ncbi:hypothetical protein [Paraburkholderia sp. JHI869]|uniref:hypothetical protein n=1 Tax=Paraburkholderia sp. JHI869 TaxID=3112959 RepID=UPI00317FBBE4